MSAFISPCERYRYRLERAGLTPLPQVILEDDTLHPLCGKTLAFFGVNPSTADASLDDATVRKWTGFCRRWGVQRYIVGNLFAFRATDVKALKAEQGCLFGPEWRRHMTSIIADADVLVPCWGSSAKIPRDLTYITAEVLMMLAQSGKPVLNFGMTSCGQPKHPLILSYSTPLTELQGKNHD